MFQIISREALLFSDFIKFDACLCVSGLTISSVIVTLVIIVSNNYYFDYMQSLCLYTHRSLLGKCMFDALFFNLGKSQVQKFITLSSLYGQIGFMRKEAFFKRVAAMQCVSQSASSPAWHQCYQLLLQALTGYNIALDPREMPQGKLKRTFASEAEENF